MSDTQEGPLDWGVGTDKKEANFEYLSFSAHHEDVYPAGHQATNTTDGQELSPVAEVHSTSTPELILPVDGLGTGPTLPMLLRDHLLGTDTPGMRGRFSMPGSQRMSLIGEEVLQPLHCRVLPPAKVSGPSGIPGVDESYWVYPILTQSSLPSWPSNQTKVHRRFKDVVALSEVLEKGLPGCILPARPRRNAVGARRAAPKFLEERRATLERYLNRLAAHPAAANSEALLLFLTSTEPDLRASTAWVRVTPTSPTAARSIKKLFKQIVGKEQATPSPADVTRQASESGDVLRMVKERLAHMQGLDKAAPLTPLERELRDEAVRMEEVQRLLGVLLAKSSAWVEQGREAAGAASDLAKALHGLASYHDAFGAGAEAAAESAAAEGVAGASALLALSVDASESHLAAIHDHLVGVPAALQALAHRERALLTVTTLEHDLAKARGSLEGTQASGTATEPKLSFLQANVASLEEAVAAARGEYTRLGARNAEEVKRWHECRATDLVAVIREVVMAQVVGAEKAQQAWEDTARKLASLGA